MDALRLDLRHALRLLRRSPGFSAAAALTLALGIGANTATFAVAHAALVRPLPFAEPERLVAVVGRWPQGDGTPLSPPDFLDYRRDARAFAGWGAHTIGVQPLALTGGGPPEQVSAALVSAGFFETLGVAPALGRTIAPADEQVMVPDVVVLGHGVWQRRFGGDPAVVGRTIVLEAHPRTVVGVMPRGFAYPVEAEVWLPLPLREAEFQVRRFHFLRATARLAPAATAAGAQAELETIAGRLARDFPDSNQGWSARVVPLREHLVGDGRRPLLVLLGAAACVLLVACANVGNLLLARGAARRRELAVRAALGGSRARLARQLLIESALLAAVGGGLGTLLAAWLGDALAALAPDALPGARDLRAGGAVLAFSAAATLITIALFGLLPAWRVAAADGAEALKDGGRAKGPARPRGRRLLVASEVALCLVLLAGAGLLVKSLARLVRVDPGFRADGVVTTAVRLPPARYEGAAMVRFFDAVLDRVARSPGVTAAGAISQLPLGGGGGDTYFTIEGRPLGPGQKLNAQIRVATPGYFPAMDIPIRAGRDLDARDRENAPAVAIVNESFAREFFPGEAAVGRRLVIDMGDPVAAEIVGVAGDVRQFQLGFAPVAEMCLPLAQSPRMAMTLAVRGSSPATLPETVRAAVAGVDPQQALGPFRAMGDLVDGSVAPSRLQAALLGSFAGLALLLAGVGLYGVVAFSVAQRAPEFGVRMALGASRGTILRLVLGEALVLALAGIAAGVAGALALGRTLAALLFEISPRDPVILAVVGATLALVALLAGYVPARRAAGVDPLAALRSE
ncbi:MAG TPA: ABC transporter permease [Vicinamibacteria bacterium]